MRCTVIVLTSAMVVYGFGGAFSLEASADDERSALSVVLGDGFQAGQDVVVDRAGLQDVFAAGEHVTLSSAAAGNVHLAGRQVEVNAAVGGSLYSVAQSIAIEASVGGRFYGGGEVVTIGPSVDIGGGARIGARRVTLDGTVRQSAAIAGHRIVINGTVDGDLEVAAQELVISQGARLTGALTYRTPEEIDVPASFADGDRVTFAPLQDHERGFQGATPGLAHWILGSVGRLVLSILGGAILLAVFPRFSGRVARAARTRPWPAIGWGAIGLITFFACIGLMVLSLLGIPLAVVLAFTTPLLLFGAYVFGAFSLSMIGAQRFWHRVPSQWTGRLGVLVVGLVALTVLGLVPVLGWLATVLTSLLGIGAALMVWRSNPASQPA